MATAPGKLCRTDLRDGTPVWLLEWELRRRLPRRVLLAVDTSDSCAHEGERRKSLFRTLASTLELGDSCALWVMGRREKAFEASIAHHDHRQRLAQNLAGNLSSVRGGTWIEKTMDAMLVEASKPSSDQTESFFLLASDGEIFDAEVLAARGLPRLGFIRLGDRESQQLEVVETYTAALTATESSLGTFLASSPLAAALKHNWRGKRWVEFSGKGEIIRELTKIDPLPISPGLGLIRVAFVGGDEPRPQLLYTAGGRSWSESRVEHSGPSPGVSTHFQLVVRALQGAGVDWDRAKLKILAADRRKEAVLDCPSPNCHRKKRLARRKLFCDCGALLVAGDGITCDEALSLYQDTIRFLVDEDGEIVGPPESGVWDTGDHAYDLWEENGRQWLVLNLHKG